MKLFFCLSLIFVSFMILFWSLITAGFDKLNDDIRTNNLRNIPIEYVKILNNGEKILKIYKVPESNIKPGDVRYPLKKIRDNLWILLSKNPKIKAEVYLLIADKRMFETTKLMLNYEKNNKLILRTLTDSICNLKKAKISLYKESKRDIEFFKIDQQIDQAGLAYEDIVKSFSYKNEGIDKLINELEIWNQKNKK